MDSQVAERRAEAGDGPGHEMKAFGLRLRRQTAGLSSHLRAADPPIAALPHQLRCQAASERHKRQPSDQTITRQLFLTMAPTKTAPDR